MVMWIIVALLCCILASITLPKIVKWWITSRYIDAFRSQELLLEEYDIYSVSPHDHERLLLGLYDSKDTRALLLDRKGIEKAKLLYPTKAKTAADKKVIFDKEEERRKRLGFQSQTVRRDYQAEQKYYRPHYEHLKAGVKIEDCWLCDQNDADADERHRQIWSSLEREEAEEKSKSSAIDVLFGMGEIPPPKSIRCEDAALFYAKLKAKNDELRFTITDWKGRTTISEGFSVIMARINTARACGKFGPCTVHVPKT